MQQTLQSLPLPTTSLTSASSGARKPRDISRDIPKLIAHVRPIFSKQNPLHPRFPIPMSVSTPVRSMENRKRLAPNVHEISMAWAKGSLAMRGILQ